MKMKDRQCGKYVFLAMLGLGPSACGGNGGHSDDDSNSQGSGGIPGFGGTETDGRGTGGMRVDGTDANSMGSGGAESDGAPMDDADGSGVPNFDIPHPPPPSGDDGEDECAAVSEAAEPIPVPADIIVVVDNSGSMGFEAAEVQANLNHFSTQIINSGIDVHVVLISSYPSGAENNNGICIDQPLGSGDCPGMDNNSPVFTHVQQKIESHNAWYRTLNTHDQWSGSIRDNSVKHLLVVTDDTSSLGWEEFNTDFQGLDPSYADYVHHSVVCHSMCLSAAGVGTNYITLSGITDGVAADLCDQDFQAVFDALSTEVIGGSALSCEFDIPAPPDGMEFDPDQVNLEFDDGMGGVLEIGRVDSADQCGEVAEGWHYDDPITPSMIVMCPDTCEALQMAVDGAINIAFGCETIPAG